MSCDNEIEMTILNKYILLLLVVFSSEPVFSQKQSGYLFRCSKDYKIDINTLRDSEYFIGFLSEEDLQNEKCDSAYHELNNEKYFEYFFLRLFDNKLQSIEPLPRKKELIDSTCTNNRYSIFTGGFALFDFVYIFKEPDQEFFYNICINKVTIDYCEIIKYGDYDTDYKKRIVLKSFPVFSSISKNEFGLLKNRLERSQKFKGAIFICPIHRSEGCESDVSDLLQ